MSGELFEVITACFEARQPSEQQLYLLCPQTAELAPGRDLTMKRN